MPRHRLRKLLGLRSLYVDPDHPPFVDSRSYWEHRYARGRDSGVGSYAALATFKAEVLNSFVRDNHVEQVLELGCGDGNQLALANYPRYVGLDVASGAVDICAARFADDATKSFFLYDPARFFDRAGVFRSDLVLSLDVLFHLVEDEVYDKYLRLLFSTASRFVCIYSSNENLPDEWPHVRHRPFTDWVEQQLPSWSLVKKVDNPFRDLETGAVADFYFYTASH